MTKEMTDQQLLADAAPTVGAKMTDYSDRTPDHWIIEHEATHWKAWNPLEDDGDAFRMGVRKQIFTAHHPLFKIAYLAELELDHRPTVAARRAIVRTVIAVYAVYGGEVD